MNGEQTVDTQRFASIGAIVAVVVVLIGVLMCLSVVPVSPVVVGACLAGLGVARLC